MNQAQIDFVKKIKPSGLPNGMDVVKEGIEMGNEIKTMRSPLLEEKQFPHYQQYKQDASEKGQVLFQLLIGLATLDEQIEGIKAIYEYGQRTMG